VLISSWQAHLTDGSNGIISLLRLVSVGRGAEFKIIVLIQFNWLFTTIMLSHSSVAVRASGEKSLRGREEGKPHILFFDRRGLSGRAAVGLWRGDDSVAIETMVKLASQRPVGGALRRSLAR
jgi:hypothetical protein